MEPLKITAILLLLFQVFQMSSLQNTTDSPGKTIDKTWLRQVQTVFENETDSGDPSTDYSGISSGSDLDGQTLLARDSGANGTTDELNAVTTTLFPVFLNGTAIPPGLPDTSVSTTATLTTTTTTAEPSNSSQVNVTEAPSTPDSMTPLNTTSFPDSTNHADVWPTTTAPENTTTAKSTTRQAGDQGLSSTTQTNLITTAAPAMNETSTTVAPPEIQETSPVITTTVAPNTVEIAKKIDTGDSSESTSDGEFPSDSHHTNRTRAWGAVLGTAVLVAFVGLVAYVIMRKKHRKAFSHRKLVEDYPSEPVHRLDNGEPLDLNFGGSAYYNPGLQGDSIQMTSIPGRRLK
ncbi:uncharacterized protein KZ484_002259 [Pholidichthys leucotaenia]